MLCDKQVLVGEAYNSTHTIELLDFMTGMSSGFRGVCLECLGFVSVSRNLGKFRSLPLVEQKPECIVLGSHRLVLQAHIVLL